MTEDLFISFLLLPLIAFQKSLDHAFIIVVTKNNNYQSMIKLTLRVMPICYLRCISWNFQAVRAHQVDISWKRERSFFIGICQLLPQHLHRKVQNSKPTVVNILDTSNSYLRRDVEGADLVGRPLSGVEEVLGAGYTLHTVNILVDNLIINDYFLTSSFKNLPNYY